MVLSTWRLKPKFSLLLLHTFTVDLSIGARDSMKSNSRLNTEAGLADAG